MPMNNYIKFALVGSSLVLLLAVAIIGLGSALVPLLLSFAVAYLVFPIIRRLEAKGISRSVSVVAVFLAVTLVTGLVSYLVIPRLVVDAVEFSKELPEIADKAATTIEATAANFGLTLDLSKESIREYLSAHKNEIRSNVTNYASSWLKGIFAGATKWILWLLNLFLIPLFFFYIINDYEKLIQQVKSFIPKAFIPKLKHYADLANIVLSGYIRGQLMVALLLGVLYAIGLSIVGLKFGLLIGILTGLFSIIPYVGFALGFVFSMAVALANYSGPAGVIAVIAVFLVVQALEGTIITPKLVGDKVGLSALATMLALIIGGNLFGLAGMIMAIPVAAIMKSILAELKGELHEINFS